VCGARHFTSSGSLFCAEGTTAANKTCRMKRQNPSGREAKPSATRCKSYFHDVKINFQTLKIYFHDVKIDFHVMKITFMSRWKNFW